ncbi:glycoside hydrolase superfamily [Boeremia exigua]|uniref:glycoside hydrolase superfamily n=1 Tax=Boeremia exigua TaxID=749465 RepID=UPI001E8ECAF1|nr:glycoside hydrolase superfamily [Boeremia exigua]KAH6625212.1 glycoside hydrolase superfamily [Boeremia exigua]
MGDAIPTDIILRHEVPHIRRAARGHSLIVKGEPFLMLPAELHNSSFSSHEFMEQVWPVLKDSSVNTILANVTWESIEPVEGHFDFAHLDQSILNAREHGFHLVLLWFGAFKNGKSDYAPRWVKTTPARFPRMTLLSEDGTPKPQNVLSILDPEVVQADSAAFRALMRHIRQIDRDYSTVLMVQVENEVGLLGGSRDVSLTATSRFEAPVPAALTEWIDKSWNSLHSSFKKNLEVYRKENHLSQAGSSSWSQAFGASSTTDELFMAYHYALYVDQVARAGKEEYALPLFANVWQNYADEDADKTQPIVVGGGGQPGDYPSGGGVINVLDVWHFFAPTLDFIAPDLYLNDYNAVCRKYRHGGQPLFIPEQRRDEYGARRIWSAYATHHALGASPFAIDSLSAAENPWRRHFGLLDQIAPWLLAARESNSETFGFWFDECVDNESVTDAHQVVMGSWRLTIERSFVFGKPGPGFGLIIQLHDATFLLVGEGFQVSFASTIKSSSFTGFLSFAEKISDPHTKQLRNGRMLNGDETRSGQLAIMPSPQPDLGTFPICITIPARSRIAEVEVYEF